MELSVGTVYAAVQHQEEAAPVYALAGS